MRSACSLFVVTSLLGLCSCSYDFGLDPADDTGPNIGFDSNSMDTKSGTSESDTESDSKDQLDTNSEIETSTDSATHSDSDSVTTSQNDTDTESDLCPDDPQKTEPGVCGCGQDETCEQLLSASKSTYNAFENIVLSYYKLPGNEWDWIGLFHEGGSNEDDIGYGYTYGQTSGTMDFGALGPGNYEARLFFDDSYNLEAAVSVVVNAPQADLVEVQAAEDAYADANYPNDNFGSSTTLFVDMDPEHFETFLKFNITQLPSQMQSAWLSLFFIDGSEIGPDVYPTGTDWTESGVTWNNRPSANGPLIDATGIVSEGWRFIDITSVITQTGTYSFSLTPNSSDGVDLNSRESTNKPKIVFVTGSK